VAVLSLMNDVLSSLEIQLLAEGDSYSLYSLGIWLGILAVALNLSVAVIAAVHAALASHFSFQPEQKTPNIEAHLIFCVIVLFRTAVVSGISLIFLSININPFFAIRCVGALFFFSGVGISIYRVLALSAFDWLTRMLHPLAILSLALSSLACMFAIAGQPDATLWLTIPNYYFTLTYHLLVDLHNLPSRSGRRGIICAFILYLSWTVFSIVTYFRNSRDFWYAITYVSVSGLTAIMFAIIGIVGCWKRRNWRRRKRPQINLAEASSSSDTRPERSTYNFSYRIFRSND
jgi:hypothetical protein